MVDVPNARNENFRPNGLTSVACQSFAGANDLGMTQAGFELLHKVERKGGFGSRNVLANSHMIGDGSWSYEDGEAEDWFDVECDVTYGNPPCSGFSLMTQGDFRGVDSPINECMWKLTEYAARNYLAGPGRPYAMVFESVQQGYWKGRTLMQALRARFEELTGLEGRVYLSHILHNARLVGNTAERRRYFMVLTVDRPFVIHDSPYLGGVETRTLRAAIDDLEAQPLDIAPRAYATTGGVAEYASRLRSATGTVDGHFINNGVWTRTVCDLLEFFGELWGPGETAQSVVTEWFDRTGELHPSLERSRETLLRTRLPSGDLRVGGFYSPIRWVYDEASRVITGGAHASAVHPTLNRMLTFREMARVMGFPDDWAIAPNAHAPMMAAWWGKQLAVECAKWIGDDLQRWFEEIEDESLLSPSSRGLEIGERERVYDHTALTKDGAGFRPYDMKKHDTRFAATSNETKEAELV